MCVAPPQVQFKRLANDPATEAAVLVTRNKEPRLLLFAKGASESEYPHFLCASTTRDRTYFEAGSRRYLLAGDRLQKLNNTEPEVRRPKPIRPQFYSTLQIG
jgi:hypothetical protein